MDYLALVRQMAQIAYDKKGHNILAVDVEGLSSLTNFFLIVEGNVDRHVTAIANVIYDELKKQGIVPVYTEGFKTGDWVVLDYGFVMVHVFMPGLRDRYSLERLWPDSKLVDLCLDTSTSSSDDFSYN
jgi:ribosome-associated protein